MAKHKLHFVKLALNGVFFFFIIVFDKKESTNKYDSHNRIDNNCFHSFIFYPSLKTKPSDRHKIVIVIPLTYTIQR